MTYSRAFGALVLATVAAASVGCDNSGAVAAPADGRGRGGRGGGAVPVTTAVATQRDVPVDVAAIGNVEAYETVSLRSQVTGVVTEVFFHEGDFVKKGDHLFTIDPRPYEAMVAQARANLARDRAQLQQSE